MYKYDGPFKSARSFLRSLTGDELSSSPLMPLEVQAAFDRVDTDTAGGPDEHQPAVYKLGGGGHATYPHCRIPQVLAYGTDTFAVEGVTRSHAAQGRRCQRC